MKKRGLLSIPISIVDITINLNSSDSCSIHETTGARSDDEIYEVVSCRGLSCGECIYSDGEIISNLHFLAEKGYISKAEVLRLELDGELCEDD